jgi:hypothetical protein
MKQQILCAIGIGNAFNYLRALLSSDRQLGHVVNSRGTRLMTIAALHCYGAYVHVYFVVSRIKHIELRLTLEHRCHADLPHLAV